MNRESKRGGLRSWLEDPRNVFILLVAVLWFGSLIWTVVDAVVVACTSSTFQTPRVILQQTEEIQQPPDTRRRFTP